MTTGRWQSGSAHARTICAALVLLLAAPGAARAQCPPPGPPADPPFRRAMILAGLGPDAVIHLGIYDAALDAGCPPDVLIGTSGGSIATAIISAYPDRRERHAFLASEEFHAYTLSPHVARSAPCDLLLQSAGWTVRRLCHARKPPNLFGPPVITFPCPQVPRRFHQPFPTDPHRPRVIIVAGALDFGPDRATRRDGKYFYETWFTDEGTVPHLLPLFSAIGLQYPDSAVHAEARVVTGVTLAAASRASCSEPYSFSPFCLAGTNYTGAAINLFPLELARSVAREVIITCSPATSDFEDISVHSAFRFSPQHRQRHVDCQPVGVRVYIRDKCDVLDGVSFFPRLGVAGGTADVQSVGRHHHEPDRRFLCPCLRLIDHVPEEHGEFVGYVRALWQFGYDRGARAFARRAAAAECLATAGVP